MKTTEENRGRMLLQAAANAWNRMADLRQRRRRNCRFTYGDQWSDTVRDRRGRAGRRLGGFHNRPRYPCVDSLAAARQSFRSMEHARQTPPRPGGGHRR